MTYRPRYQSRTTRQGYKRQARNYLGTMRDGAPSTRNTLLAARNVSHMVNLATDGALRLVLEDREGNLVAWPDAITNADTRLNA